MLYVSEYSSFGDFFFQAEDGIRDLVRSRGLGDVYKRQLRHTGTRENSRRGSSGSELQGPDPNDCSQR